MVRRSGGRCTFLVVCVALGLIAASCSDSGSDPNATAFTIDGEATPAATSDDACPDDTVAVGPEGETITAMIEQAVEEDGLHSVLYRATKGGELIAAGAIGDNTTGVPLTQSAHFRNGNVAFAYVGTLLLLMAEAGELSLDDPLSRWLPDEDVPDADSVTLEMLANHTSGYPDYVPNDDFLDAFNADPFADFTPQELVEIGLSTPPFYEPGTAWNYSHTNFVLLGAALAEAGGAPLEDLLADRVLEPMGLADTAPVLTPELPDPALHTFTTERGVLEESTYWNPSWQTAPGAVVVTTICDMVASARSVGTGEILTEESFARMIAPTTAELGPPPPSCPEGVCRELNEEFYFGIGVIELGGWIIQTPQFGGAGALHAYLPEEDIAIAMVAVTGAEADPEVNYAQRTWAAMTTALTPDHTPPS